jgi:UDP-glucose 4-epimerase
MSSGKKYLVTGGAGFIGSHLVERLVSEGNTVTVYDNLVSGKKKDIQHHIGKPNFRFIEADLLDFAALKEAMQGQEIVWHLAANTDIPGGNRITDLDLKNCTIGTWNILDIMRQLKIDKLLFASSATVYGDTPLVPLAETYGPLLPISLYGAGKLACEGFVSAYCHLFGIQAWIFRFANVVGGGMGHGVIYDFIQKLERNTGDLEILGDGKQEKPYFLVEDCIEGMFCAFRNSDAQYDVYNLGCDTFSTVTNVGKIVIGEMGLKDVHIRYTGGRRGWPGDVPVVRFDPGKMARWGWKASHTSDEAVRIAARRLIEGRP